MRSTFNQGNKYEGLVYSALGADRQRVGKPLKSSLFGKNEGVARLEEKMQSSGEAIKSGKLAEGTKAAVSDALKSSRTESQLRDALRKKGIDVVLRRNDAGRIYGATFIDHNSRTVVNSSRLGKEFSANALNQRFADNSLREDLQVQVPKPAENIRNAPAADDKGKQPKPVLSDVSEAAGSLLSVLTPDGEGQDDNKAAPRRRKKKKRKYGRQM